MEQNSKLVRLFAVLRTIADIGPHDDLMKKLGTYRRLYDLQFAEMEQPRAGVRH